MTSRELTCVACHALPTLFTPILGEFEFKPLLVFEKGRGNVDAKRNDRVKLAAVLGGQTFPTACLR